jgi:hypothetical protein
VDQYVENQRRQTVEFVRKHGLKVCRISSQKRPYENEWNKPEFYEAQQENILNGFIRGNWMMGIITGVKCGNGYYLAVVDVDSKKFYEKIMTQYDNQTCVVKSGGSKEFGAKKQFRCIITFLFAHRSKRSVSTRKVTT